MTLITLLTATPIDLFVGSTLFTVGEFKSLVKLELVVFTVVLSADTQLKLSDITLKTIATAKSNFLLIIPPPNPKTTPTLFNNLNRYFIKF
ncbi:hypothetical protein ASJ80_12115 [Methanobacterium bryantii]|uniref:Uncharacterized protein n=1 Tax=Methanobacterium bryantii TaxID=2161 RepID=A0A2A2H6Y1_METBR|nr:hypothetical protein ASJ80_12115 [Methanobacterium bryantii]